MGTDADSEHDLIMLGLRTGKPFNLSTLSVCFQNTRGCKWLTSRLEEHEGELYFGEASALLHDALLDDPKPYRKDVKVLLGNLLHWASVAVPERFALDSPQHSQRIRLRNLGGSKKRQQGKGAKQIQKLNNRRAKLRSRSDG
jgi:hypothetical protein